jgi:anti-sigma regulatory factor (Ser/Thr protein kinase)
MGAHPSRLARGTGRHRPAQAVQQAAAMAGLAVGNWPLSPDPAPMGWTCLPPVTAGTPRTHAGSVRAARDFTLATLRRWGATQRSEDVAIVVSELMTNALLHALRPAAAGGRPPGPAGVARWPVRLGLQQPGPCVLCAVADPSEVAPAPRKPGDLAESGRGLTIVAALSDRWGYTTPGDMGKVVWALFATRAALHDDARCRKVLRVRWGS